MTGSTQALLAYGSGATALNLVISADTSNYNIFTAAGSPTVATAVTLTINSGVNVYGAGISAALDTGTGWPSGSTISVINNGSIIGYQGSGGYNSSGGVGGSPGQGSHGYDGGPGLHAQYPLSLTNNGSIVGGGGGGGSGNNIDASVGGGSVANFGGNGYGGLHVAAQAGGNGGQGGVKSAVFCFGGTTASNSTSSGGAAGSSSEGGSAGGANAYNAPLGFTGTTTTGGGGAGQAGGGGGGGDVGYHGGVGSAVYNAQYGYPSNAGGFPGSCVLGSSNVTTITTGTQIGLVDDIQDYLPAAFVIPAVRASAGTATASLTFNSDGTWSSTATGTVTATSGSNWHHPTNSGIGASYWINAVAATGTGLSNPSTGTTGAWTSLSSAQAWTLAVSTVTSARCSLSIKIATDSAGVNVIASGTFILDAYRSV